MLFIKSILIGIGKILPGVSGSVIAISLGLYEKIIYSLRNINNKKNIKFIFIVSLGIILSIVLGSKVLFYLINNYYFYTISIFIGLIFGGIYNLSKIIKCFYKSLYFYISLFILLLSNLMITNKPKIIDNIFISFLLGMIESVTTIIPGISGSAIFINLGYYNDLLYKWSQLFDYKLIMSTLAFILPYLIGFSLISYFLIKIIDYLLKNHRNNTYKSILGFSYGSLFLLVFTIFQYLNNLVNILIFIILFLVGFIIGKNLDKI